MSPVHIRALRSSVRSGVQTTEPDGIGQRGHLRQITRSAPPACSILPHLRRVSSCKLCHVIKKPLGGGTYLGADPSRIIRLVAGSNPSSLACAPTPHCQIRRCPRVIADSDAMSLRIASRHLTWRRGRERASERAIERRHETAHPEAVVRRFPAQGRASRSWSQGAGSVGRSASISTCGSNPTTQSS